MSLPLDNSPTLISAQQQAMREAKWKSCQHWLNQLLRTFPKPESPLTPERLTAMASTMESYSEAALAKVCGPKGIIQIQTFLPSPSELKQALEEAEKPAREDQRRLATSLARMEDRAEQARIDAERPSRPTYEQLIAKLPDWLKVNPSRAPSFTPAEKEAFLTKYKVTQEELDKIPDRSSKTEDFKPVLSANPVAPDEPVRSPQVPSQEGSLDNAHDLQS